MWVYVYRLGGAPSSDAIRESLQHRVVARGRLRQRRLQPPLAEQAAATLAAGLLLANLAAINLAPSLANLAAINLAPSLANLATILAPSLATLANLAPNLLLAYILPNLAPNLATLANHAPNLVLGVSNLALHLARSLGARCNLAREVGVAIWREIRNKIRREIRREVVEVDEGDGARGARRGIA